MKANKFILLTLGMFILNIVLVTSSAGGAAGGAAAATIIINQNNQDQADYENKVHNSNCLPPFEWAKEHNCELKYPDRYDLRVGVFRCGYFVLHTSCKGNVDSIDDFSPKPLYIFGMNPIILSNIILYSVFGLFICMMILVIIKALTGWSIFG